MSSNSGKAITTEDLKKSLDPEIWRLLDPLQNTLVKFINTPDTRHTERPIVMMIIARIAARVKSDSIVNPFQRLGLLQASDDCFTFPWDDTMKLKQLSEKLNPLLSIPKPKEVTPDMVGSMQPQYKERQIVVSQTLSMFPDCLVNIPRVDEFNLRHQIKTSGTFITHQALFDHILYIIDGFVALSQFLPHVVPGSETPVKAEGGDDDEVDDEVDGPILPSEGFMSKTPILTPSEFLKTLQQRLMPTAPVSRRVFKFNLIHRNPMLDLEMKKLGYYTLLIEAILYLRINGNVSDAAYKFKKLYELFVKLQRLIFDICVFLVGPEAVRIKVYTDFTTHMTVTTKHKDYFGLIFKISQKLYRDKSNTNPHIIEFLVRSLLFLLPPAHIKIVVECIVTLSGPGITYGDAEEYISSHPGIRSLLVRIFNIWDVPEILDYIGIVYDSSSESSSQRSYQGGTTRRNHKRSNKKYTLKTRFSKNKQTKTRKVNRIRK
jgi:hypothetical protein